MENNNRVPNFVKLKPYYIFPDNSKKLIEDMSVDELEAARIYLYEKNVRKRKEQVQLDKVTAEIEEMFRFKTQNQLNKSIEESYTEDTEGTGANVWKTGL